MPKDSISECFQMINSKISGQFKLLHRTHGNTNNCKVKYSTCAALCLSFRREAKQMARLTEDICKILRKEQL